MRPVYLSGRGIACALGLDIEASLMSLHLGGLEPERRTLPGESDASFPYFSIPRTITDWNERARELVQRVAEEAGAHQARDGALFIATSSFDIGAVEQGALPGEYRTFSDKIAAWLGWSGPVYTISTACTSSINALLSAHALLSAGGVNDVLILGVELDNKLTLGGFAALQLLSSSSSKPFSVHRDGMVLGESVAALRLSTRESSIWKILGGASVVNGSQPASASACAVTSMYQRALKTSRLSASDIDLVKVQAAGSPGNDAVEAKGLRDAFPILPALVSLKAVMGHTMGASGAAELALLTACLEKGVWPRYADDTDETLGVHLAKAQPESVSLLMATILGFGGSHATVVLQRS
jgi:3-oxoacyl-[acyl-carrier-protein] synthase-1